MQAVELSRLIRRRNRVIGAYNLVIMICIVIRASGQIVKIFPSAQGVDLIVPTVYFRREYLDLFTEIHSTGGAWQVLIRPDLTLSINFLNFNSI